MTRGPFPAQTRQSVVYEVRIYSISGSSFGEVIWAKRIRAAHCLTSLQFSPTSEHILLAYGRWVSHCDCSSRLSGIFVDRLHGVSPNAESPSTSHEDVVQSCSSQD